MKNPELVKAIYAELRATAGRLVPAGELLKLAYVICQAFRADFVTPEEKKKSERTGWGDFHCLPVDEAMNDGGWNVLDFERTRMPLMEEIAPEQIMLTHAKLTRLLGHEWQKLIPPG